MEEYNIELVTEEMTWLANEKIWNENGIRVISKEGMEVYIEYIIF